MVRRKKESEKLVRLYTRATKGKHKGTYSKFAGWGKK